MTPRKFLELPTTFSFSLQCFFCSFGFLLQHLTLTLQLTWRTRKAKSLIRCLALTCAASALGRYKCYTCSGGGRKGDIGRRLTPFCYHKGFNSQLPRKKFAASKPESVCLECHSRLSLWIFMSWIFKRINTLEISLHDHLGVSLNLWRDLRNANGSIFITNGHVEIFHHYTSTL